MGKYDDITPEKLRSELLRFARLITKMEEEGVLLEKTPSVLGWRAEVPGPPSTISRNCPAVRRKTRRPKLSISGVGVGVRRQEN